jgi:hypothetical protein
VHIAIGYAWANFTTGYHLERAFRALGHDVTYVGIPNGPRAGFGGAESVRDVLRALPNSPDLYVWVDSSGRYFPRDIEALDAPTACYLIDVHLGEWRKQAARFFDWVFVAQKDYVTPFVAATGRDNVRWLPLAAAGDVHVRHDLPRIYDVGFVGATGASHRGSSRARRLKLISEAGFKTNDFFRFYAPDEMSRIYSQSKIVFNTSIAGDVTMRVFEGTACGAMLLTDTVKNGLGDLFVAGEELVTYTDDADLIAKLRHYLDPAHAQERERIAEAGYARTRTHHTYEHRAQAILDATAQPNAHKAALRGAAPDDIRTARREVYTHLGMLDAILDDARAAGLNPLRRLWGAVPCLARRVLK